MSYKKNFTLTIDQQITDLFNNNKNLYNDFNIINPTTLNDIRKKSRQLLANKKVANIADKINRKLKTFNINQWYQYTFNKSFEYNQFIRLLGYVQQKNKWVKWHKMMIPINQVQLKFFNSGIVETNLEFQWDYYAKYKNIYFKKINNLVFFILNKSKKIVINQEFLEKIKTKFNVKNASTRNIINCLERDKKLQKIESNVFIFSKTNKLKIAQKMFLKICPHTHQIIYFTKKVFMIIVAEIISQYKLLQDEPYYIFKEFYKDNFYFSHGNQMFFTVKKEYATYKMHKRIKKFVKRPYVLNIYEMESQLGLNKFSVVNIDIVKICGDKFLIYDANNKDHFNYLKKIFEPFIKNYKNNAFTVKDLRLFCKFSSDINIQRLSKYKQITSIFLNLFPSVLYDKDRAKEFMLKN